jgi:mono/diheme cytochrome c family protein
MKMGILSILATMLFSALLFCSGAQANELPNMPYVFEANCFLCHREPEQTGPSSIFDMRSKTGNPLHEQYIRNNVRFGISAMPAFRISEVSPKALDDIVNYLKTVAAYRKEHPDYKPMPGPEEGIEK